MIGPWMNFAIDAFGADRCMFEVRSRPLYLYLF